MLIRFTMHVSLALLTKREETPNEQNEPSTVIKLVIEIARSNLPLFYRRNSRPTNRNGSGVPTFWQAFADLDRHQNDAHFICFRPKQQETTNERNEPWTEIERAIKAAPSDFPIF